MGIDLYAFDFLLNFKAQGLGDTLCLGRQGFHVTKREGNAAIAQEILSRHDAGGVLEDLMSPDGYSEKFLRYLGARTVLSMDMSANEGAELLFDLNQPIPEEFHDRFDFIFDGGTSEHIYDFPAVMDNVKAMLRQNGVYVGINTANNMLGHGLYQFSPELFWWVFSKEQGYSVEKMQLMPIFGRPAPVDLIDTAGHRQEVGPTKGPTYVVVAARRTGPRPTGSVGIHQSDYAAAWSRPVAKQPRAAVAPVVPPWPELRDTYTKLCAAIAADSAQSASNPFLRKFWAALQRPESELAEFIGNRQRGFESTLWNGHGKAGGRGNAGQRPRIPRFTHRIWITADATPTIPPDDFIEPYLASLMAMPADAVHFFWSNSKAVRAHVAAKAAAVGCANFMPADTALFAGDAIHATVTRLTGDRKYVLAADVMKFVILHRFGGIYSDLGIIYDRRVFALLCLAEYGLMLGGAGFFQTGMMACAAGAELAALFLAVLHHPESFNPAYALMKPEPSAADEVHIFAGPGFTAAALLFMPGDADTLVLPSQSPFLRGRSQRSWYGKEAKHGNVLITATPPSILDAPAVNSAAALAVFAIQVFGKAYRLAEQLRILLLTARYFDQHPTRLSRIFHAHGSDRALGWHNYGHVYTYILGQMARPPRRILELSQGAGAAAPALARGSLRGWREAYPAAELIAAGPAAPGLMADAGVEAHLVDQADPDSVAALFAALAGRPLDLVVDDGMHTLAVSSGFLSAAYPHLAKHGLHIIEDVPNRDIPGWAIFLQAAGYSAVLVRLPHSTNASDNCLIVVEAAS